MWPNKTACQAPVAQRLAEAAGLLGLGVFAFGYIGGRAIANIGLGLLLLAFLLQLPRCHRFLRRDPLVLLGLAWMGYILALASWANWRDPDTGQYSALTETWSFAFIPLVALATRGNSRRVLGVLLLALGGLMFRLVRDLNFDGGAWLRYDAFALGGGRNLGVLFIDVGILGCITLLTCLFGRSWPPVRRFTAIVAIGACVVLLVYAWVQARSRLSLIGLPLCLVLLFVLRRRTLPHNHRTVRVLYVALLLGMALGVATYWSEIAAELIKDGATWRALISGRLDAVEIDATGYRIHMWQLAHSYWIAHPLTGVGPSVSHLLASDPQRPFLAGFNQFHNSYVELLLRTGLIGATFYLSAALLVVHAAVQATRTGAMPRALGDFLLVSFLIYALLCTANSILFFQQGWHFLVLFGGLAYGYRWRPVVTPPPIRP